jgi:hypothetical protein
MASGLTGGTNDINPNRLAVALPAATLTTTSSATYNLPIPIAEFDARRPIVLELLKVHIDWGSFNPINTLADAATNAVTFDRNNAVIRIQEQPSVSATASGGVVVEASKYWTQWSQKTTAAVVYSGFFETPQSEWIDVTDGNGHGIICPGQFLYLFLSNNSGNTYAANTILVEIYYRFKAISQADMLTAMITLVQGS